MMKCSRFTAHCLLGFFFIHTQASEVTWTAKPYPVEGKEGERLSTGIFNQAGKLILAENSGGPATTFDHIRFSTSNINFGKTWTQYHTEDQLLSNTGTWNESKAPSMVCLNGLIPGKKYRIQTLIYDGRSEIGIIGKTVKFDGQNQGIYANSQKEITWGNGLLVTGIFTASSTEQSFTIETFRPNGGRSSSGQLNAILVHEISGVQPSPDKTSSSDSVREPSAVIAIGGITLAIQPVHHPTHSN